MTTGLIALYGAGFVAARIIARLKLDKLLLNHMVCYANTSRRTLAATMIGTLFLSTFIPNFITVLLMIPLVPSLAPNPSASDLPPQQYDASGYRITLTLGIIYAANIGGIASLVGSPANALLLLALDSQRIAAESLTFLRWLVFGVPMALVLLGLAGGILVLTRGDTLPKHTTAHGSANQALNHDQRTGLLVITLLLVGAIIYSSYDTDAVRMVPLIGVAAALLSPFAIPLAGNRSRLLRPQDLIDGLPWRGFTVAAAAVLIATLLHQTGVVPPLLSALSRHLPTLHPMTTLLVLVTITIFLTEILSNSVTAIGMWAVALAVIPPTKSDILPLMVAISFASTSAFMSPISTPATALAFGESPKQTLQPMLTVGLRMNLIAAAWISLCAYTWIPWVLDA